MDNSKLVEPSELLNDQQKDEVKNHVIESFGEAFVKKVDMLFMAMVDERMASADAYEFLERVSKKFPEHPEEMVAALLVGMKFGELAAGFVLKAQHAEELDKVKKEASSGDEDGAVIAPHVSFSEGMYG